MNAKTENRIRQEQMKSFGNLLAGFSHDMRNHLAVIRESNGLMEDIVAMDRRAEDDPTMMKLKKSIALIEQRVSVSAELYRHLSNFAHRSDTPLSSFHLNDLVTELTAFFVRSARLRQINLQVESGRGIQAVYNDPALLQHIIYRLYMFCLERLEKGRRLIMSTTQENAFAVLTFRLSQVSQVSLANLSDTLDTIFAAVSKLEGKLESELETDDGCADSVGIRLLIPSLAAGKIKYECG